MIKSNVAPPSLFERLTDKYPEISVQLTDQYRMNNDILKLSNQCVYQNIIKCANNQVESQRLKIDLDRVKKYQKNVKNTWLNEVLDPDRPVIFIDYLDFINKEKPEFLNTHSDSNAIECDIVVAIIHALKNTKFDLDNVGIITPYKAQENLLLSKLCESDFYNVYTIDKSQGLEKEVIIISFVKINKRTKLLKDLSRINVAFTRPKSKLILVGLIDCLNEIEKLKNYIDVIKREGWCYKIDKV